MQLLSSNGQLFELSDAAARQSVTLQDLAQNVADGAPVKVDVLDSGRLQKITLLLERTAEAFGLEGMADERRDALLENGLPHGDMGAQLRAATAAVLEGVDGMDLATRLLDLKWFNAPLLTSVLAEGVARLLSGKSADALRTLLAAADDLGDQEKEAALREQLFTLPAAAPDGDAAAPAAAPAAAAPPRLARSVLLAMDEGADDDGNMMACLKRCDARTLRQLKAVSAGWQQRARRALLDRLDAEELDVEELQHVGLHEAVAAARQMPNLARLRGYGFRVELDGPQGVRQAALGGADPEGPLGGAALRSCIHEGEGETPHELLLAAVACAAPGTVSGVPVQQLREDNAIGSLELDFNYPALGVIGAELLGLMLPAATSLRELSLAGNELCGLDDEGNGTYTAEGITKLCEGLKGSAVTSLDLGQNHIADEGACAALAAVLKETLITHLDLNSNDIGPEGGAALAEGLKGNSTLQSLDLNSNDIGPEGGAAIAEGLKGNSTLQSLDLGCNKLCGLNVSGHGTYTADGITKLCEALKGSAVTSLNIMGNYIGAEGVSALAAILKETQITTLGISYNNIGDEGASALAAVLKESQITDLRLVSNVLCGVKDGQGTYTAEGITKLCGALKGSAVISLSLGGNDLRDETKQALEDAAGSSVCISF